MKKSIIFWLTLLFLLLVFSEIISCKNAKPLVTEAQKVVFVQKDFTAHFKDQVTDNSLAINDTIKLLAGKLYTQRKDCDSVANIAFQNYLSQLDYQKTSGNNAWKIKFDKLKSEFVVTLNQAKTTTTIIHDTIFKDKFIYKSNDKLVQVPVKYIPDWVRYLAIFGGISLFGILMYGGYRIRKSIPV